MAILRQQIIDALLAQLGTIRVVNNYRTDLGLHVFEWKATKFEDRDLPGINVKDPSQTDDDSLAEDENLVRHDLTVEIAAACAKRHDAPETIRMMVADIEKALKVDLTLGGLAENIKSVGNVMGVAQDNVILAGNTMTIVIKYLTEKFNEE